VVVLRLLAQNCISVDEQRTRVRRHRGRLRRRLDVTERRSGRPALEAAPSSATARRWPARRRSSYRGTRFRPPAP
jgi:hypothetical protein